jgi:hypothetical protein
LNLFAPPVRRDATPAQVVPREKSVPSIQMACRGKSN